MPSAERKHRTEGVPRGERHHRAKLSDAEVDLMRELHEAHQVSIPECAKKFEVPYNTAYDICVYKTRA